MTDINDQKLVLDMDALKAAFMGDTAIVKQILFAFQDTFRDFQKEFETLHSDAKIIELSRLVHGLKGSSANIRANTLATQAAELQQQIDQEQDYTQTYRHLLVTLSRINQEIDAVIAN